VTCIHSMQAISEESMLVDLLMMKQANFNAVRMSHYPNCHRFYTLCSALGLYVIDEANLETHGFDATLQRNELNPANSPLWTSCMLDRVLRMFERHKNEPCVSLPWSLQLYMIRCTRVVQNANAGCCCHLYARTQSACCHHHSRLFGADASSRGALVMSPATVLCTLQWPAIFALAILTASSTTKVVAPRHPPPT
jgi:Glycosyl hydrolases family 2, TIM barrel domain